tara:strand:+ start:451 stop:726 length:276 start_codon:yes stop_codon:yes gene_type:complete
MLAKLTEIYALPMQTGRSFGLREIFINPKSVSMIRSEPSMKRHLSEGSLPSGLDERIEFSRISVDSSQIVVVGSPFVVEQTLKETRHLLKG